MLLSTVLKDTTATTISTETVAVVTAARGAVATVAAVIDAVTITDN